MPLSLYSILNSLCTWLRILSMWIFKGGFLNEWAVRYFTTWTCVVLAPLIMTELVRFLEVNDICWVFVSLIFILGIRFTWCYSSVWKLVQDHFFRELQVWLNRYQVAHLCSWFSDYLKQDCMQFWRKTPPLFFLDRILMLYFVEALNPCSVFLFFKRSFNT